MATCNTAAIARPTEEVFGVTVSHLEEPGRFRELLAEVRLGLPARADHPADAPGGPDPPDRPGSGTGSCTWADVVAPDGHIAIAELVTGEGVRATAAIAAETTQRVLAGAKPGAWTPGQLFSAALVTDATGAQVTINGQLA